VQMLAITDEILAAQLDELRVAGRS
jgi:hypothetical protein